MRHHTFWLKTSIVFMLLTAGIHSISFFIKPVAQNETERQLLDLMTNYKQDAGAGFMPSMYNLFNSMSACFSLMYLLGGLIMTFLLRKKVSNEILKGISGIYIFVFGICFLVMLFLTFLPPIILTGIVFFCVSIGYALIPKGI